MPCPNLSYLIRDYMTQCLLRTTHMLPNLWGHVLPQAPQAPQASSTAGLLPFEELQI